MARFTLEIACDNAAFTDDDGDLSHLMAVRECGRILQGLSRRLLHVTDNDPHQWGGILDGNGNRVGAWDYADRQS